jgi:DNA-binding beta-propeller fold protein YncE
LKKSALLVALVVISFDLVCCGGGSSSKSTTKPVSGLTTRVFASQSIASLTASPGLIIINGETDTLARAAVVGAGTSPGLMAISPQRATVLVFDSATNNVAVVNTKTETLAGTIPLPGPTTSMVAVTNSTGYAAVSAAPLIGSAPGAIEVMDLQANAVTSSISVPSAQTVVSNPSGTELLVFSNDSNAVTVVSPLFLNTSSPVTTTVPGFDRPVYAVFSNDGSTAYVLNCGLECGGTQASVQTLSIATLAAGTPVPVDAATIGLLSGSTLYVAGTPATNSACTGQTTAATTCGRLDIVNLGSMTVSGRVVITDGYHDRIDISNNGQLFIGAQTCTNIGNVNNVTGEVRGCLSIFDTTTPGNTTAVIPPDNGDVTGFQTLSRPVETNVGSGSVEYVAEGGNLRVYNTLTDTLLLDQFIETGTITITGQITDVKAVDFF